MASEADISAVQLELPTNAETEYGWGSNKIGQVLDATNSSLNQTLRLFWTDVANKYLLMADISESGSSRQLSVYYDRAKDRIAYYDALINKAIEVAQTNRQRISFGQINRE